MNNMNTNNLRAVHTTEKRPSLQETSLQVKKNLRFLRPTIHCVY